MSQVFSSLVPCVNGVGYEVKDSVINFDMRGEIFSKYETVDSLSLVFSNNINSNVERFTAYPFASTSVEQEGIEPSTSRGIIPYSKTRALLLSYRP